MCGIIGYVGHREAVPILLNGLMRLEYRGYDSAGIAVLHNGSAQITKVKGKVVNLIDRLNNGFVSGTIGLGHTRWATHGEPSERNAHPHTDCQKRIILIHNGIIENYYTLKVMLSAKGHIFRTDTDSEVLAHLIEEFYQGNIEQAVREALQQVKGTYGLAVLCCDEPNKIVAARMGSPLVVGLGSGEYFIASDMAAMVEHTRDVIYLNDGEIAVVSQNGVYHTDLKAREVPKDVAHIYFDLEEIEKGGFPHFMLKEIFEQPESLTNTIRGRLIEEEGNAKLGGLAEFEKQLREV
ncbi:MAG: glutamine--fructose-6-phosphate aminotransferase, partial [bacterium]